MLHIHLKVFNRAPLFLSSSGWRSGGRNQDVCGGCETGGVKSLVQSAPTVPAPSARHLRQLPGPVPGTVSGRPAEAPGASSSPASGANGPPACMLAAGRA